MRAPNFLLAVRERWPAVPCHVALSGGSSQQVLASARPSGDSLLLRCAKTESCIIRWCNPGSDIHHLGIFYVLWASHRFCPHSRGRTMQGRDPLEVPIGCAHHHPRTAAPSATYELGDLEQVARPYLQIIFLICKMGVNPLGFLGRSNKIFHLKCFAECLAHSKHSNVSCDGGGGD